MTPSQRSRSGMESAFSASGEAKPPRCRPTSTSKAKRSSVSSAEASAPYSASRSGVSISQQTRDHQPAPPLVSAALAAPTGIGLP